ncbi:MAG: hydrogenase formation protein HypD [Desulfovibrio sp.]|nr:hydrogenase formation protein HypD [Desulfovibrio sp.]
MERQFFDFSKAFSDPGLARSLVHAIERECVEPLTFMEVCGTHTVAIFRSGIHSILPETVVHLSGPGCPVCVTHEQEVELFLQVAARNDAIVATFGDLMRVPGMQGKSLKTAQAEGARVEVVYAPFDALDLARANPDKQVVFLGVGFETTAPAIAATMQMAKAQGLSNFLVLSMHKLVPPALKALLDDASARVDAFMLPGHVSLVLGLAPYQFIAREYDIPAVVAGFEPLDILAALLTLARQRNAIRQGAVAEIVNDYPRAVREAGNPKARAVMDEVFTVVDARWRGLGVIPQSGLAIAEAYADQDAMRVLGLTMPEPRTLPGCKCGDVLKGKIRPDQCPLFKKACTPATPVGPCMVSTEGSCAAYFKYHAEV